MAMTIEAAGGGLVVAAEAVGLVTRREALRRVAWLLGGAVSAPTVSGVLAGCGRSAASAASVLSADQAEMMAVIADHIVPGTDTPGARAAGVPEFIDRMLAEYYPAEVRDQFLAGLANVDERATDAHGAAFVECSPEQQLALLTALDREAFAAAPTANAGSADEPAAASEPSREPAADPNASPPPQQAEAERRAPPPASVEAPASELDPTAGQWVWGEEPPALPDADVPFMRRMKELTLVGYYTSEVGATQELRHEPVPGRFDGCVPFAQIGRTWAV